MDDELNPMDDELQDRLSFMLNYFGWRQTPGEQLAGFTLVVHTMVKDTEVMGSEILHFGPPESAHHAMHGIANTVNAIIGKEHTEMGLDN